MEGPMESLVRLLLTTLEFQIMKLWQHVLRALLRNEGLPGVETSADRIGNSREFRAFNVAGALPDGPDLAGHGREWVRQGKAALPWPAFKIEGIR